MFQQTKRPKTSATWKAWKVEAWNARQLAAAGQQAGQDNALTDLGKYFSNQILLSKSGSANSSEMLIKTENDGLLVTRRALTATRQGRQTISRRQKM